MTSNIITQKNIIDNNNKMTKVNNNDIIDFLDYNKIKYGFMTTKCDYIKKSQKLKIKQPMKWINGKPYKYNDFNKNINFHDLKNEFIDTYTKKKLDNLYTPDKGQVPYISIDTTNINILDIDDPILFKKEKPELFKKIQDTPSYLSRNSHFKDDPSEHRHYLINVKNRKSGCTKKTGYGDLLAGTATLCKLHTEIKNSKKQIIDIDYDELLLTKNIEEPHKNIEKSHDVKLVKIKFFDEILNLFNKFKKCEEVSDRVGWLILAGVIKYQCGKSGKLKFINSSYDTSDLSEVDKIWSEAKDCHIHWLFKICKKYDEKNFFKIIDKHNYIYDGRNVEHGIHKNINFTYTDDGTAGISSVMYQLAKDKFIYHDGKWYIYNGNYWQMEEENLTLHSYCSNELYSYFGWFIDEQNKISNDIKKSEEIREQAQKIGESVYKTAKKCRNIITIKQIIEHSKSFFRSNNDFRFNSNKYLIQHKNCVYDLENNIFIKSNPKFYISQCTAITITEKNEEDIEYLEKIIDNIFYKYPINKSNYMEFLANGLFGETLEKIFICSGGGGNGKGLLNDLVLYMLNDDVGNGYAYEAPSHIFQSDTKGGPNPEVHNMSNKRFVRTSEASQNAPFSSRNMKNYSGGSRINARALYSNKTNCYICPAMAFEVNFRVMIDSFCGGISRRLMCIIFHSSFIEGATENKKLKIFEADKYFKTDVFKIKYSEAMFYILVKYWKSYQERNYLFLHNIDSENEKKEYAILSDEFTEWINEHYETVEDPKIFVKIKDMYSHYRQLSKKNKRTNNKKWILNKIEINPIYKKNYRLQASSKISKKRERNIIICLRLKNNNHVDDFDDFDEPIYDKIDNITNVNINTSPTAIKKKQEYEKIYFSEKETKNIKSYLTPI